jgi:hypothetical protein
MECPNLPDEDDYCIEQALNALFEAKASECDSFFKLDQDGTREAVAGCALVGFYQHGPTRPRAAPLQEFGMCTQKEIVRTIYRFNVMTGGCMSGWTPDQAKRLAGQVHRLIMRCLCQARINDPDNPLWKYVSISRLETDRVTSKSLHNGCDIYTYHTEFAFDYECDWCA